jgi:hypothetical protein
LVVFGLSIVLGRLRRRTLQCAPTAATRLLESIRQLEKAAWDAVDKSKEIRRRTKVRRGPRGARVVTVTETPDFAAGAKSLALLGRLHRMEARVLGMDSSPSGKRSSQRAIWPAPSIPEPAVPPAGVAREPGVVGPDGKERPRTGGKGSKAPPPVTVLPVTEPLPPSPPRLTRTVYPTLHGSMEVVRDENGRVVAIEHWRRV